MSETPTRLHNRVIKAFDAVGFWHDPYGLYADAVVAQLTGDMPSPDPLANHKPDVRED